MYTNKQFWRNLLSNITTRAKITEKVNAYLSLQEKLIKKKKLHVLMSLNLEDK